MATTSSSNVQLGSPCDIQCLQGNMRHSKPRLLSLFGDIANKNIYPKGIDIMFLTEPPCITKANKLADIPDNIFNCFAEKSDRYNIMEMSTILHSGYCCMPSKIQQLSLHIL